MSVTLRTPLCDMLGCRYPIVQTAMGWVATAQLVIGTGKAGGFGFLAGATMSTEEMEASILAVKAATDAPFGVNFHSFQPNAAEIVDLVIKHRVRAVSYGRGPSAKIIKRMKDEGVLCMPTIGAPKHAVKAVELGADIITVQGGEGGGHTGFIPTTVLLPQVLDAVKVPVVAAGGMFDGRSLAAALAWGASGIAMGSRFLMTTDSPVPESTKKRYLAAKDPSEIRITYAVDGMSQRFVINEEIKRLENMGRLPRLVMSLRHALQYGRETGMTMTQMLKVARDAAFGDGMGFAETVMAANLPVMVQKGVVEGDAVHGLLPGGQAIAAIRKLESCEELIGRIVSEASARLEALGAAHLTQNSGAA